ncbi:MAG: glycosyltransferase [Lachnospiraceae bacterium]|jgi:glycosyltransferase involved in cell wall biosynthesis|nr:glycosyltransferase [Lachnospiraceae bacterium]
MNLPDTKIIMFTEGDANSVDTWSNIPYFLSQSLEAAGAVVYRSDIGPASSPKAEKLLFLCVDFAAHCLRKVVGNNPIYELNRTSVYYQSVLRKMKNALAQHPDVKNCLTLTFSHSGALLSKCPPRTFMLCDWPIEYLIKVQQNRTPGILEKLAIKRQIKEILAADYVITLFPDVQEFMERTYKRKILYLGNVINSKLIDFPEKETIEKKARNNHYLFIGRQKYINSAISLVQAAEHYNKNHETKITIDIIGLTKEMNPLFSSDYVQCYGYLSKENEEQEKLYYNLILHAKAIVNTTEGWNGMSSLIEAMYYDTPVIIVPNPNIIKTFGNQCDFGVYCKKDTCKAVLEAILTIQAMPNKDYVLTCQQAHKKVETFTWTNYAKKLISLIKND